jgi:UDP-N-acetyl-D-glucosamine dehydrogenase
MSKTKATDSVGNREHEETPSENEPQAAASGQALRDTLDRMQKGDLSVAILGLGYVGIPLAEAYVRSGVRVLGVDVNQSRVDMLNNGTSGMRHIDDERIQRMVDSGKFRATTDASALSDYDALIIAVPTPLDRYHHPDLSYVVATCDTIKTVLRPGQLVVLESTTYPGTTQEIMRPILEESGLKVGDDFALAYSPEREDPGNIDFETSTIPKLVGADSALERDLAKAVYEKVVTTVMVPNTRTAEAAKLTENIFRWVNIGLVNELKLVYDKMGIDVWDVIKAADSKPFGFMAFYPGPGVGGHCIRIDPYYLTWKAREHGVSTRFIELAGEVNIAMPNHVVSRLMEELNLRHGKALSGARILLCGVAYKKNIDDVRESPSLEILSLLERHGAKVDIYDPYVPIVPRTHDYPEFEGRKSIEWNSEILGEFDAALIATDHKFVDYAMLVNEVPLVVDTRNVTKDLPEELLKKVSKA